MSFSSNLATWLGSTPNALQSGRVDCYVGANNDKTGYSLTAGSYSVRASSTQFGTVTNSSSVTGTATISSVTVTRATLHFGGVSTGTAGTWTEGNTRLTLTNATTVTGTKGSAANSTDAAFCILELF